MRNYINFMMVLVITVARLSAETSTPPRITRVNFDDDDIIVTIENMDEPLHETSPSLSWSTNLTDWSEVGIHDNTLNQINNLGTGIVQFVLNDDTFLPLEDVYFKAEKTIIPRRGLSIDPLGWLVEVYEDDIGYWGEFYISVEVTNTGDLDLYLPTDPFDHPGYIIQNGNTLSEIGDNIIAVAVADDDNPRDTDDWFILEEGETRTFTTFTAIFADEAGQGGLYQVGLSGIAWTSDVTEGLSSTSLDTPYQTDVMNIPGP